MGLELVLSCQTCGGTLIFDADGKHAKCKNCGNEYFFKEEKTEALTVALNEANEYLRHDFFDDALMKFRPLRERYPEDAEVAWGMAMATYGIVFAKDDRTGNLVPTCSRTVKESILQNADYLAATANAADEQRPTYEKLAAQIDKLQKKIKRAMEDEEDYDVFISFKAKDENGHPTKDSLVARNIYDELTKKGIKTFFSEVTLADRLGDDYEPIIFRALYSCKFFILVGTKEEYINAAWVKNEWTRFRDRAAEENLSGACFAVFDGGVDRALPRLFSAQGINLAEYPAGGYEKRIADNLALKLGIEEKKSEAEEELRRQMEETQAALRDLRNRSAAPTVAAPAAPAVAPLLERAFLFLEDGKWQDANIYCEKVLDIDPKNAEAYLGKLMAEQQVKERKKLADCAKPFDNSENYAKVIRFGDEKTEAELREYIAQIKERNETARLTALYTAAVEAMKNAKTEADYKAAAAAFEKTPGFRDADVQAAECRGKAEAARLAALYTAAVVLMKKAKTEADYKAAAAAFEETPGFRDAAALAAECREKAEAARKDAIYAAAKVKMTAGTIAKCEKAIREFESIPGWRDADDQKAACQKEIEKLKAKAETDRLERERQEQIRKAEEEKAEKRAMIAMIAPIVIICVIAFFIILGTVIIPTSNYNKAMSLKDAGKYSEAIAAFEALDGYKDSKQQIYNAALNLYNAGQYSEAIAAFEALDGYKDSKQQIYNAALSLYNAGEYSEAITAFEALDGYKDSKQQITACQYNVALCLYNAGQYREAITAFEALDGYKDSIARIAGIKVDHQDDLLQNAKVGDTIIFGAYEQDNNTSNEKEKIEWQVLAKKGTKILVISKYALDCKQYHTSLAFGTWEPCSLRTWLNKTFYNNAFGTAEKAKIVKTTVNAEDPGNATSDNVFLLSIAEVNEYFSGDEARRCAPTAYAIAQGASTNSDYTVGGKATCWWWLRSYSTDRFYYGYVHTVGNDGSVRDYEEYVFDHQGAVRPALWIDLAA